MADFNTAPNSSYSTPLEVQVSEERVIRIEPKVSPISCSITNNDRNVSIPHEINEAENIANTAVDLGTQIAEATDFFVTYTVSPFRPGLCITGSSASQSQRLTSEEMRLRALSENKCFYCYCYCCFLPKSKHWQTIYLEQNQTNVLSFIYQPEVCCFRRTREQTAYVYIPLTSEPIGWIKYSKSLKHGAIIKDCLTNSTFYVTSPIKGESCPRTGINILDSVEGQVAQAKGVDSVNFWGSTTWTSFQVQFPPQTDMSVSSKAVSLVASLVWILNYRENALGKRCGCLAGLFIGILLVTFLIWLFTAQLSS